MHFVRGHLDVAAQDARRRQPRPRQDRRGGGRHPRPHAEEGSAADLEGDQVAPPRTPRTSRGGDASVEDLRIHTIAVDGGPIAKRWMPRSMGRANRINHRTSHLTVVVTRREGVGDTWDRKHIRSASASASSRRGRRSGTRRRTTPSGCTRTCKLKALHQEEAQPRGRLLHRDRARGEQGEDQHPHRAPGHRDRQARRGRRDPEEGRPGADRERGVPEHHRGPQGRDQRAARRREHRDAARAPHRLPPRHEEGDADRDEVRRQGHQASRRRAASAAPRCAAASGTSEGRVPLHTLRADIEYGFTEAHTTYGTIGVKAGSSTARSCRPLASRSPRGPAGGTPTAGVRASRCCHPSAPSSASPTRATSPATRRAATRSRSATSACRSLEPGWITARQIEAARVAISRHVKKLGKIYVRVFPDHPFTKKPAETRMGTGKGGVEGWVAVVRPGRVIFEVEGVSDEIAQAPRSPRPPQAADQDPA